MPIFSKCLMISTLFSDSHFAPVGLAFPLSFDAGLGQHAPDVDSQDVACEPARRPTKHVAHAALLRLEWNRYPIGNPRKARENS